jgi:hypothetical protein
LHLATEPVAAQEIYRAVTGRDMPQTGARLHHEDMRTLHAGLRGGTGPYLETANQVMFRLRAFVDKQRGAT